MYPTVRFGAVFRIRQCYGAVPTVRFGYILCPTVRFGAFFQYRKTYGAVRCGFQEGKNPTVPNRTEPIEKPAPYKTLKFCPLVQPIKRNRIGRSWFKLKDGNDLPHEYRLHYLLKCHKIGIILTAMTSGRNDKTIFFVQDLLIGLALAAKRSPIDQSLKKVNNGQAFPQEETFFFYAAGARYPKARLQKNWRNIGRSDCVGPILSTR